MKRIVSFLKVYRELCGRWGHSAQFCRQRNYQGASSWNKRPQFNHQGNDQGMHAYMGRQVSPATVGPQDINVITPVAAVSTQASVIVGNMGGVRMEMMLDSGSSVSLIQEESIPYNACIVKFRPAPRSQLVTASGEKLKIIDYVSASVQLGEWHIDHNFFVVNRMISSPRNSWN